MPDPEGPGKYNREALRLGDVDPTPTRGRSRIEKLWWFTRGRVCFESPQHE